MSRVGPDPADRRPPPPRRDHVVRPTRWGRQAQQIWAPLTGVISQRWRERFGAAVVDQLARALPAVISPPADAWPPFLPVSGVQPAGPGRRQPTVSPEHRVASADLATLMARALMSFRAEFETESAVPLPVSANVLRVLSAGGVALPEVPRRAGISKEAVSVSAGWLERQGYVVNEPDPAGGRGRQVRLTPRGEQAQDHYHRLADQIGDGWRARSGDGVIDGLAGALRALYAQPDGQPLDRGRAGAVPRRLAGAPALPAADRGHDRRSGRGAPPLSDGDPPRRLPRRQLTAWCRNPVGQCPACSRRPRAVDQGLIQACLPHESERGIQEE